MKVVLDTNILISGFLWPKSPPGVILELARQRKISVYLSSFIVYEFKMVLVSKFDYSENLAQKFVDEFLKFCTLIIVEDNVNLIKEKESDNRILETALSAKADYLISGDQKHILPIKKISKTKIISAKDFIKILKKIST